jgi:uncharacterized protein YbjT (DUF2867 family)
VAQVPWVVRLQLAQSGTQVRVVARDPQKVGLAAPVEVLYGDLTRPETLEPCLNGIDAVFLVWVAPPTTVGAVIEAIARRTRRIVFLSAPLKTPHPLFQQPNEARNLGAKIESAIEASQLQWTFLRPGMFAANAIEWWGGQTRAGNVVRWPYLDVPTAPIDPRDIAAVAIRALLEEKHVKAEYVLTGPQSLTHRDQISIIGRAIGRSLEIEEMSPDEARRELLKIMPLPVINMLLDAWAPASGHPAHMTSTVEEITGRPAITFQDWASDHATNFQP